MMVSRLFCFVSCLCRRRRLRHPSAVIRYAHIVPLLFSNSITIQTTELDLPNAAELRFDDDDNDNGKLYMCAFVSLVALGSYIHSFWRVGPGHFNVIYKPLPFSS